MVDSPDGDRKRSAHWSESDTEILVDLLLKRRESGRTTDNGFRPEVWKEASDLLINAEVGGLKTPTACKSRWQRRDYKIVKDIEGLPGFRWDRKEHRLIASQETWDLAEQQQQIESSKYQKISLPQYDALTILCPPEGIRKRGTLKGHRGSLGNSSLSESTSSMISIAVSSSSNSTEGAGQNGTQARTALPAGLGGAYGDGMIHMGGMMWSHHPDGQISPGAPGGYGQSYGMTSHYPVDQSMMSSQNEAHRQPAHSQHQQQQQQPPHQHQHQHQHALTTPNDPSPAMSPATSSHPQLSPVMSNRLGVDNTSLNSPQLPPRPSPSKRTRHSTRRSVQLSPTSSMQYLSPTIEYSNPMDTNTYNNAAPPHQYTHDTTSTPHAESSSSATAQRMPPPHRNSGPTPTTAMPHPAHTATHLQESTPTHSPRSHSPLHQSQTLPPPPSAPHFQPQSSSAAQGYLLPSPTYISSGGSYPFPPTPITSYPPHTIPTTATASGPMPLPPLPPSTNPSPTHTTPIPPEVVSAGLSEAQRRTEALLQLQEKEADMRDEDIVEVMAEFAENMASADTYLAIKKATLRKLWLGKLVKRRRKG